MYVYCIKCHPYYYNYSTVYCICMVGTANPKVNFNCGDVNF